MYFYSCALVFLLSYSCKYLRKQYFALRYLCTCTSIWALAACLHTYTLVQVLAQVLELRTWAIAYLRTRALAHVLAHFRTFALPYLRTCTRIAHLHTCTCAGTCTLAYLRICMLAYLRICALTHLRMYWRSCVLLHLRTCTFAYLHTCTRTCSLTHLYLLICLLAHLPTCTLVQVLEQVLAHLLHTCSLTQAIACLLKYLFT